MSGLEERLKELLEKQDKMAKERQVKNSDIISIKEWNSWSEERQESIIAFVTIACEMNDDMKFNPNDFDKETLKYIAKNGLIKILKNI